MGAFWRGETARPRRQFYLLTNKHGSGGGAVTKITSHPPGSKSGRVRRCFSRLTPIAHQPRLVAVPVAHFLGLALVVQLLAAPERDRDLRATLGVEVDAERNDGHAFPLDALREFDDFLGVQEKFARALRFVVETVGLKVFRDIGVVENDCSAAVD